MIAQLSQGWCPADNAPGGIQAHTGWGLHQAKADGVAIGVLNFRIIGGFYTGLGGDGPHRCETGRGIGSVLYAEVETLLVSAAIKILNGKFHSKSARHIGLPGHQASGLIHGHALGALQAPADGVALGIRGQGLVGPGLAPGG